MDKKAKPNPSTLAVDPELRLRVRNLARQHGMTALELANLFIAFALDNCEIEKPSPTVKYKQQVLPV